jgi:hypothetical protein
MDAVTWTDEKLDLLDKKVEVGFARTDERFKAIDRQLEDLKAGQAQMNDKFDAMNGRFDAMNGRFDAMQRTLIQVGFSLVVGLIGGLVALIVAVLVTH